MTNLPLSETPKPSVSPLTAVFMIAAQVPLIAVLVVLETALGLTNFLFMGFIFMLYWMGIKETAPAEFMPTLVGALAGLGLAYLIYLLLGALGFPGSLLAMACAALSLYLLIRGQAKTVINLAFMLFLTIATSPLFKAESDYALSAASIVLSALYVGGMMQLGRVVLSLKKRFPRGAASE